MTDQQKIQTRRLRAEGHGYKDIATLLGISDNTIKSFCRREGLTGQAETPAKIVVDTHVCKQCGLPVAQNKGRKEKKFCSDKCRMAWWNSHQDIVKRKAIYEYVCPYCQNPFTAYGNNHRKYCSRACSFADRFGGDKDE